MTAYHGGKQKIGKEIASVIYDIVSKTESKFKGYCEPFCGMCGVYQYIQDLFKDHQRMTYRASDINESLILMWQDAQSGWLPPTSIFSVTEFDKLKGDGVSSSLKGFIGHMYSYRGIYFSSYFKHTGSKIAYSSNRVSHLALNKMNKVKFHHGNYTRFSGLKNHILYCDPPYSTTECRFYDEETNIRRFDNNKFYKWLEKMAKTNLVFVSERADLPYKCVAIMSNEEKLFIVT